MNEIPLSSQVETLLSSTDSTEDRQTVKSVSVDNGLLLSSSTPKCLSSYGVETAVTHQYRKALDDINQFVTRYRAAACSNQPSGTLPQATDIAKSFIAIDKILFKKLRSPECDDLIEIIPLLEVIGRIFNYLPRISIEAQGCDELIAVILQTIGLMGAFVPTSFRDLMPLQVAGGLASLPLTSHRLCLDILCWNVLPLCLTRTGKGDDTPGMCAAGVLAHVLQQCPSNAVHARVLETIMSLKEGVCIDLLQLIAHCSSASRQSAVRLLFHYFPQVQLSGNYHTKLKPGSWSQPMCQFRGCLTNGERKTATKMCMNAICASTTGGHYPPLYLCESCCNTVHPEDRESHLIISLCQPLRGIAPHCEEESCVGGQLVSVTCYDFRCTKGGSPRRMCTLCEQRFHPPREQNRHFPVQKSVPILSQCDGVMDASFLVEAVVALLCEAAYETSTLRSANTRNTRARLRQTTTSTGILERTAELDPTKDSRLLSQFGIILLTTYCTADCVKEDNLLGRLVGAAVTWLDGTAQMERGVIKDNLQPMNTKFVKPWIIRICQAYFSTLVRCLEPNPPSFGRVGKHWTSISSRTDQYKLGLQRLFNFMLSGCMGEEATFRLWNAIMPSWLKVLSQNVTRGDLHEFEPLMKKLFALKLFRQTDVYDKFEFLKTGLAAKTIWEQIQYLHCFQVLLHTHITVPKIDGCFIDILMMEVQPQVPTNPVTASLGEPTADVRTCPTDPPVRQTAAGYTRKFSPTGTRTLMPVSLASSAEKLSRCSPVPSSLSVASLSALMGGGEPSHYQRIPLPTMGSPGELSTGGVTPMSGDSLDEQSMHLEVKLRLHRTQSARQQTRQENSVHDNSRAKLDLRRSLPPHTQNSVVADKVEDTAPAVKNTTSWSRKRRRKRGLGTDSSIHSVSRQSIKETLSAAFSIGHSRSTIMQSQLGSTAQLSEASTQPPAGTASNQPVSSEGEDECDESNLDTFPRVVPNSCALLLRSVIMLDAIAVLLSREDWKESGEVSRVDEVVVKRLLVVMLELDWGDHSGGQTASKGASFIGKGDGQQQQQQQQQHSVEKCTHCKLQRWWFRLAKKIMLHFFPHKDTFVWKDTQADLILTAVMEGVTGSAAASRALSLGSSHCEDEEGPEVSHRKQTRFSCDVQKAGSASSIEVSSSRVRFVNLVRQAHQSFCDGSRPSLASISSNSGKDSKAVPELLIQPSTDDVGNTVKGVPRQTSLLATAINSLADDDMNMPGPPPPCPTPTAPLSPASSLKKQDPARLVKQVSSGMRFVNLVRQAHQAFRDGNRPSLASLSSLTGPGKEGKTVPELLVRPPSMASSGKGLSRQNNVFTASNPSLQDEDGAVHGILQGQLSPGGSLKADQVTKSPKSLFEKQPVLVQIFLGLLQKLVVINAGQCGPYLDVLACLDVLMQHANCLQLIKVLAPTLQHQLITQTLVPRLWELMTAVDPGNAVAVYTSLTGCLRYGAGTLALADRVKDMLESSRWQQRFRGVEQVMTLQYAVQSSLSQNEGFPGLSGIMALVFTMLMDFLRDSSNHVSLRCMMLLENMPLASLKMMVSSAERQFFAVPTDRLPLLRAFHQLLDVMPMTSAISEGFFCRMLQAIQTENDPQEDVAIPVLHLFSQHSVTGGDTDGDWDYGEGPVHRSAGSTSSYTSNNKANVERVSSDDQYSIFKHSAAYDLLTMYTPVPLLDHASPAFLAFITGLFEDDSTGFAEPLARASRRQSVRTDSAPSCSHGIRIDNSAEKAPEPAIVLHSIVDLFMKYMLTHPPSTPANAPRKFGSINTVRILLSMMKALMGCKVRSSITVFTRPPRAIRAQPAFNAYLHSIAKVMDSNFEWGSRFLPFTLSLLRFIAAPNLEEGLAMSGPHYGLEHLSPESQQAWLHTVLVILYKYPYQASEIQDVVRILLLTLQARPHTKCIHAQRHSQISSVSSYTQARLKVLRQADNSLKEVDAGSTDHLAVIGEVDGEEDSESSKRPSLEDCFQPAASAKAKSRGSGTYVHDYTTATVVSDDSITTTHISQSTLNSDVSPSSSNDGTRAKATLSLSDPPETPKRAMAKPGIRRALSYSSQSGTDSPVCFLSERPASAGDAVPLHLAGQRSLHGSSSQGQQQPHLYTTAVDMFRSRIRNLSFNQEVARDMSMISGHHTPGTDKDYDMAVFREVPILTNLDSPNANVLRCPKCGHVVAQFSDHVLALAIVCLEPTIQRYPNTAAPQLLDILKTVSRLAILSTLDSSTSGKFTSTQAVARQFIRTVLGHFVNNQLFLLIFKASTADCNVLKAMVASLPEPGQVPPMYKGLTMLGVVSNLLRDISRPVAGPPMMTIISNLADYMQFLPNLSPESFETLLPQFERFFRKLPAVFDSISFLKRKYIVPLRIMAVLLHNVDRRFQVLLPSFASMLTYLLRQPHQMIPLGALLIVCFRSILNFSSIKDKERLPRCISAELISAWRGKSLPHRSTFLNMIKFAAIDCGANITDIVGFDGKELPSSSLPRNLRVRHHLLSSMDVAVNFLQSTYASTTLYQDVRTSAMVKVGTAQLVGLEITGYQNKAQMERLLPWLHSYTPATLAQLTELQLVQRFRLFCWLLVAAMAADNNDDHSVCQPFVDGWVTVSNCIAQHCAVFLRSFQEKLSNGKDRRVQILPMMFTTCMLWTVYLEQHCIAEQAGDDFWGQLMTSILGLLNFKSRLYESVITTPFLDMIEGFAQSESSYLHKIWPIWLPLLRCSSSQFIKPEHDFIVQKLRSPGPDTRFSVPRRRVILRWLQGVQLKLVEHEQSWEKSLFNQLRSRTTAARR